MALTKESLARTALAVVITMGLAALVGYASNSTADNAWYQSLVKSDLNPPGWVFAVVWPCLYTLMAIAAAYLYERKAYNALNLFAIQLAVNYAWSFIFFTMELKLLAFVWILVLLALVLWWVRSLYRLSKPLVYMQIPYILWLCFAAYLSGSIVTLNP
jgi:benzodiazapine receptor